MLHITLLVCPLIILHFGVGNALTPKIIQNFQKHIPNEKRLTAMPNTDKAFMASKEYLLLYNYYKNTEAMCTDSLYDMFKGLRDSRFLGISERSKEIFCG